MPAAPRRVFLSYSSRDRARVMEIAQALADRGLLPWRDRNEILGGENYGPRIVEAVKQSVAVLLCCSRNSVGNKNVKQEVQLAWNYDVPCLPLLLDGVTDFAQLEYWLTGIQYVDTLNGPDGEWLAEVGKAIDRMTLSDGSPRQSGRLPAGPDATASAQLEGLSGLRALARFTDRI